MTSHIRKTLSDIRGGKWRKSNQIHNWFVANVQDGTDDCDEYWVSEKQLIELKEVCKTVLDHSVLIDGQIVNGSRMTERGWEDILEEGKVIMNPEAAATHLPSASGFFFGSTDYDEYYLRDVKYTYDALNKINFLIPEYSFYYRSSW